MLDYIDDYESQTILGTTYDFKKEEGLGYRNIAALIFRYHDFEYFQIH